MTEDKSDFTGDDQLQEELEAIETESEDDTKNVEEEAEEVPESDDQDKGDEESEEEDAGVFQDTDEPEIPVKRNASYIIQRQRETIERLRSKETREPVDDTAPDEGEDDNLDTDSGDDVVAREVARQLKPFTEKIAAETEEAELSDLFKEDPDAKTFEKTIRAYMKHPAWAQVPPAAIYHHLAFQHAQAKGAKQRQVADLEASETKGAGSARRAMSSGRKSGEFPTASEIDEMSDEELDQLDHQVRAGKFAKR